MLLPALITFRNALPTMRAADDGFSVCCVASAISEGKIARNPRSIAASSLLRIPSSSSCGIVRVAAGVVGMRSVPDEGSNIPRTLSEIAGNLSQEFAAHRGGLPDPAPPPHIHSVPHTGSRQIMRLRSTFLGLFALAGLLQAQAPTGTDPLPVDPKVTIGTLPNGIRYYIRKNARPEKRAELRLVVNAGSILEDEDQRGLAHFIEHMAFNGTTHYRKNDLVSYLQSIGVRFGADLNAYTDFDETVYILPVPSDTLRLVERGFQILSDWARGQTLDATEVTNERGVVLEEWRTGRGAGERMLQQFLPIALKGSIYARRLPIGTKESIESATTARLRSFYDTWYRPDLMAVVAVGDFDPATIEGLIKREFSPLKNPAKDQKRTSPVVPPNTAPLIAVATDKEATSSDIELSFKLSKETTRTVGDYRRDLMEQLYQSMLNGRLREISQQPDAPFLGAGVSKGNFIGRETDAFTLSAGVKDGGI